ncbi:hypothetical protein A8C56_08495 [Niabella ginsenosidivorans]|uniref:Serine aminopeptidase S33 domain-containing protein n=1 Tax=Niabella ginsenosidivorans TaxID=1176587 RepID=A0A1A9I2T8_9BACT|nr:alpha/beta fold hydrolase [Niabella ginsenosidivorans]ANH81011.1 hypothetical protein A8C56_08495 [Niabella ginsenosidivorans]
MKLQHFIKGALKARLRVTAVFSERRAGNRAFKIFCTPLGKGSYGITPVMSSAEVLRLSFNNVPLRGYRWNKNASKKLLIAHGFRSHTQRFEHLVPALTAKGYEIIAFDAPAHGLSGGKQINAIDYTAVIRRIQKEYGPFSSYIGHSFGGLALALSIAELPENKNLRMVLFAPATNTDELARTFLKEMGIKNEKVRSHFYKNVQLLSGGKNLDWFSVKRCVGNIQSGILWIQDKTDPVIAAAGAVEIQQMNYPNIEFVFTDGLGHSKIYRDPAVLDQVFRFL